MWQHLFVELAGVSGNQTWGVGFTHGLGFGNRVLRISSVKDKSPASGRLVVGDQVLSVNGVPCGGLTPSEVQHRIAQSANGTLVLEVLREEEEEEKMSQNGCTETVSHEESVSMHSSSQHFQSTLESGRVKDGAVVSHQSSSHVAESSEVHSSSTGSHLVGLPGVSSEITSHSESVSESKSELRTEQSLPLFADVPAVVAVESVGISSSDIPGPPLEFTMPPKPTVVSHPPCEEKSAMDIPVAVLASAPEPVHVPAEEPSVPKPGAMPVVLEQTPMSVVPEPTAAPIVPESTPAPIVPEPAPAPVVAEPTTASVVPEPAATPAVPEPVSMPVAPEPVTMPAVVPVVSAPAAIPSVPEPVVTMAVVPEPPQAEVTAAAPEVAEPIPPPPQFEDVPAPIAPAQEHIPQPEGVSQVDPAETTSPVIERKEIKETLQEIIKEIDKEVIKDFQQSEKKTTVHTESSLTQETIQMDTSEQTSTITSTASYGEVSHDQSSKLPEESHVGGFSVKKISSTGHSLWTPGGTIVKGTDQPFSQPIDFSSSNLDSTRIAPIWAPTKVDYVPQPLPDVPEFIPSIGPAEIHIVPPVAEPPKPVPVTMRNGNLGQERPKSLNIDQFNGEFDKDCNPSQKGFVANLNLLRSVSGPDMPICRKLSEDELKKIFTPAEDTALISPSSHGRKMYASSYFYADPKNLYPTVEEQLDLARKISDSLSSDTNKESKGQDMFERRKKRSHKWVHEESAAAQGHTITATSMQESYSHTVNGQTSSQQRSSAAVTHSDGGNKPPLKLVLNPVSVKDWSATRQGLYSDHLTLSPEICADLVKDLQQPKGKGAMLFAKRKKKSEQWVVDSTNRKNPADAAVGAAPPPPKPTFGTPSSAPSTGPATAFGRAIETQNVKINEIQQRLAEPKVKLVKSPWEAALQTGSVDAAFLSRPKGPANDVISSVMDAAYSAPPKLPPTPPLVVDTPKSTYKEPQVLKPKAPIGWGPDTPGYTAPPAMAPPPTPSMPPPPAQAPAPQSYAPASQEPKRPASYSDYHNFNTAARGWGQFQQFYKPVTFTSVS